MRAAMGGARSSSAVDRRPARGPGANGRGRGRALLLAGVLLLTGGWAVAQTPLVLDVESTQGAVQLGEPIDLRLSLVAPAGARVTLPGENAPLGPFELVHAGAPAAAPAGRGQVRHEVVLRVRTFAADSSQVVLPMLVAEVALPGESTPRRVRSAPLTLGLERISAAAEARGDTLDLRPLKSVIELPLGWPRWPLYLLLVLIAAGIAAYLWRRRRRPVALPAIVDRRPCDVIALEALSELRAAGLARRGDLMGHYVRLTDIVRPYLERRYGFPAVDLTSSEILAAVEPALQADGPERAGALTSELAQLLSAADLVKFAKHRPAPALAEGELDRAAEFVRATAPPRVPPVGSGSPSAPPSPTPRSPTRAPLPPPPPPTVPAAPPPPPPPPSRTAGRVIGSVR